MKTFKIFWEIDIEADTAVEACITAQLIQRNIQSKANALALLLRGCHY